jgi:hypothetical protein
MKKTREWRISRFSFPFSSPTTINLYYNLSAALVVMDSFQLDNIVVTARLAFQHVQVAAKPPITEVSDGVWTLPTAQLFPNKIHGEKGLFCASFRTFQKICYGPFVGFGACFKFYSVFLLDRK